jgi:hypothetical protein
VRLDLGGLGGPVEGCVECGEDGVFASSPEKADSESGRVAGSTEGPWDSTGGSMEISIGPVVATRVW